MTVLKFVSLVTFGLFFMYIGAVSHENDIASACAKYGNSNSAAWYTYFTCN